MQDIDPENKSLVACFPEDVGMDEACFQLEYDILILGTIPQCSRNQYLTFK